MSDTVKVMFPEGVRDWPSRPKMDSLIFMSEPVPSHYWTFHHLIGGRDYEWVAHAYRDDSSMQNPDDFYYGGSW